MKNNQIYSELIHYADAEYLLTLPEEKLVEIYNRLMEA